jgi:hypothetical protein
VNRSRRRNRFALDLLAYRSYVRLLRDRWRFDNEFSESAHRTTTLDRPIR